MEFSRTHALALVATGALIATVTPADRQAEVTAVFAAPGLYRTHAAVAYDRRSVPPGSRVQIVERPNNKGGIDVTLRVWRLRPARRYDAYVNTRRCGATPATAGLRVQNGPSRRHYSQNEVWLGFRTNRSGDATARVRQYWIFKPGQANSVVFHSHVASARVACVTVPFS